jgi:DNA-binding Lrp family transcriptional regulator
MKEKLLLNVLRELMKNSRQSDRTIAERLGISQPTVTRARITLEKKNYINRYTAIPSFPKIGYELIAISL